MKNKEFIRQIWELEMDGFILEVKMGNLSANYPSLTLAI